MIERTARRRLEQALPPQAGGISPRRLAMILSTIIGFGGGE
jgi:hypothetical protein